VTVNGDTTTTCAPNAASEEFIGSILNVDKRPPVETGGLFIYFWYNMIMVTSLSITVIDGQSKSFRLAQLVGSLADYKFFSSNQRSNVMTQQSDATFSNVNGAVYLTLTQALIDSFGNQEYYQVKIANVVAFEGSIYVDGASASVAGTPGTVIWSQITSKPTTFGPSPHTHVVDDITDSVPITKISPTGATSGQVLTYDGVKISWSTITSNGAVPSASSTSQGLVKLTGDLGGTADSPTVPGLSTKAPLANPTFTGNVSGITKTMVGLSNVDNTTDANKPISTATATALGGKANTTHTHVADNVTDFNTATVTAIGGKLWFGTQAAYDAIITKDASTLYVVS
jgi:hypothetical protein